MKTHPQNQEFLLAAGFIKASEINTPLKPNGKSANVEKWSTTDEFGEVHLHIKFSESHPPYCELRSGYNGVRVEAFSEQKLITELTDRGFGLGNKQSHVKKQD